jgi:hypothetical protein
MHEPLKLEDFINIIFKNDKILHQDEVILKELFQKNVNVELINRIMIEVNFLHKLFEHLFLLS